LHVPQLIDVEVAQVVRRYAAAGELDAEGGSEALADFADFPLPRYPQDLLLRRIWELRHNLTVYDLLTLLTPRHLAGRYLRATAGSPPAGHEAQVELV
jgi:predicted nucleic acid-binding protein